MAANGISTLSTKAARQIAKLDIAEAKRQGYATIVQNTTAYSLPTNFNLGDIKITVNNVDDVYLHFYNSVPTISNQLKVGMIVTLDWDGRAPNTVAYIASPLLDFPGHAWRAQGLGFLLKIITTTELPGNSEDYNIEALHIPNGTFAGSGSADATKPYARALNNYALADLPTQYTNNAVTDNTNTDGLKQGRPWSTVPLGVVDTLGFFEQQLDGGTYMTFNESISGVTVQAITTNFNGNPTNGSYIKINGVLIAGDRFGTAPDGTNTTTAPFQMLRGHTITILDPATATSRSGFPKCYDTYGGVGLAAPPTAGIANDIKNAAAGDIIVMGTYDATSVSAAMRSAMNTYTGSTSTNTWSAVRISHMFLAKRNTTP